MAKVGEQWYEDGDKIIQVKQQDWNAMLAHNEALRDNGNAEFGESRLVGSLDPALINEWLKEAGVSWDDPAMDDVIKKKMLSGEFDKLRVWKGNY